MAQRAYKKTGMEITQTETIKQHNSNSNQQSSHTHFFAIITEKFPSIYIYHKDSYRQLSKIPKIQVKKTLRGQTLNEQRKKTGQKCNPRVKQPHCKADISQERNVRTKGFCRIRLLKSGELLRQPSNLGKLQKARKASYCRVPFLARSIHGPHRQIMEAFPLKAVSEAIGDVLILFLGHTVIPEVATCLWYLLMKFAKGS